MHDEDDLDAAAADGAFLADGVLFAALVGARHALGGHVDGDARERARVLVGPGGAAEVESAHGGEGVGLDHREAGAERRVVGAEEARAPFAGGGFAARREDVRARAQLAGYLCAGKKGCLGQKQVTF